MALIDLTAAVLTEYGIGDSSLTFLRHNENAVYRVESPEGDTYILRLHIAASGLSTDALMHKREWLESELLFIKALHDHSDIIVQQPILTKKGSLLAEIPDSHENASLLSWITGNVLDQKAKNAEKNASLVGELAAKMHNFIDQWPASNNLKRPLYNSERVMNTINSIEDGITLGLFTDSLYQELCEGAKQICMEMDRENNNPNSHGLIHSDLGLGNLIVHDKGISPIDFGLCGHGPFLLDIGGLMGTFDFPLLRKAVIDGYSKFRPLSTYDFRSIETFFLSTVYFFMSLHLRNVPMQEWFGRRLPSFIKDYVHPFVTGESFLHVLIDK